MTTKRQKRLRDQIRRSRARLMARDPALAMVLMYLRFFATKKVRRISTNGRAIMFDPDWFQKLGKLETDYILSHVVLHIVLGDVKRPAFFMGDRFHHACDIIVASILRDRGWRCEELPHIGRLPYRTYFPGHEGIELTTLEAYREVPFDPSRLSPSERRRYQIDSDQYWGLGDVPPDGTLILFPGFDMLAEEEVEEEQTRVKLKYERFLQVSTVVPVDSAEEAGEEDSAGGQQDGGADYHDPKEGSSGAQEAENILSEKNALSEEDALDAAIDRLLNLIEAAESSSEKQSLLIERVCTGLGSARLEWRKILDGFLQEELNDYSFQPPDRRFDDNGFFLPDFNQSEHSLKHVLFMVDGSGSVDDTTVADVYGEICAAIEQFDGKLRGLLSFFDTQVSTPEPFGSIQQLLRIRPKGSGGTDFGCIFRWLDRNPETEPSCVVIITDGLGEYPPEYVARDVPVLWILYGNAPFPHWGKHARIRKQRDR